MLVMFSPLDLNILSTFLTKSALFGPTDKIELYAITIVPPIIIKKTAPFKIYLDNLFFINEFDNPFFFLYLNTLVYITTNIKQYIGKIKLANISKNVY